MMKLSSNVLFSVAFAAAATNAAASGKGGAGGKSHHNNGGSGGNLWEILQRAKLYPYRSTKHFILILSRSNLSIQIASFFFF